MRRFVSLRTGLRTGRRTSRWTGPWTRVPAAFVAVAFALAGTGCAFLRPRPPEPWRLPPVESAPFRGSRVQEVVLEREGKSLRLTAMLETDGTVFTLAGLGPMGQRLIRITWTRDSVGQETDPSVPARIDGAAILRDVVFAHWPAESLREAMAGTAWSAAFDGPRRTLYRKGRPWLAVHPEAAGSAGPESGGDWLVIEHTAEGYSVKVRTVEEDAVPEREGA